MTHWVRLAEGVLVYPDDFDSSAFPAGKRIAVSRMMGICSVVAFLLIIACCFALPWLRDNQTVNPFVIYVDTANGEWQLIGRPLGEKNVQYYQSIQRALVGIFTEKWFTISGNPTENERNWKRCNRENECTRRIPNTFANLDGCDIYCIAGENLYQKFVTDVLPVYQVHESNNEKWYLDPNKITVFQAGNITQTGGTWVARATVYSNLNGYFNIIAYVKVAYDPARYPQTLGYYINGFNAYRE